ncbi:hypothetical protein Tco_0818404 [Tanacetum coccineum]
MGTHGHGCSRIFKYPRCCCSDLKAGMDVKCGSYLKKYTKSEVQMNKITEADIDRALVNLFTIRMRKQEDLVSAVAKAAKNTVLLVLFCGGPVDVSFA